MTLPSPIDGEQHALHGHGWLAEWSVEDLTDDRAVLSMRHTPETWPWAYAVRQILSLEPGRLTIEMSVTNDTDEPMPLGIGFHPYFERPARISATVDGMWRTGEDVLPDGWQPSSPFRAHDVDGLVLDNTFTGWDRRAVVDAPAGRLHVSSDLGLLHLYVPRGRNYFCLEPVTAAADAMNHPDRGLTTLQSGATATAFMRIGTD